jgi:hypothetical protein
MILRAAAITLVAIAGTAQARPPIPAPPPSPPDPSAADQADDANFDDDAPHHGFQAGVSLGGAMQIGRLPHSTGGGLGFSARLGAAATRRLSLLFAIDSTTFLLQTTQLNGMKDTSANSSGLFSLGAQLYLRDALWLRGGAGFAAFSQSAHTGDAAVKLYSGLGASFGAGVDLVRRDHLVATIELTLIGARYPDGSVAGGFLGLGLGYR